jgi:hypothetical protein
MYHSISYLCKRLIGHIFLHNYLTIPRFDL